MIKGLAFTRAVIAAAAREDAPNAMKAYAESRWGPDCLASRLADVGGFQMLSTIKAEVAAGGTVSGNWAQLVVDIDGAAAEFFALVRERGLIGRLSGLRNVPLRTRLISLATGFSAAWVGEGRAKPIGKASFAQETLDPRKIAALAVFTRELLDSADPAAETTIRNDMVEAIGAAIDASFIDPANAGEALVEPASVTYGVTPVPSTGTARGNIEALIADFPGDLERAVLVGSPENFALMADRNDSIDLGVRGGEALGIPAVPTKAIGDNIALIDPDGIAWGAGETDIRTSTQASIEMVDTSPTGNSITVNGGIAASLVSLWQTNSVGVMCEQVVSWEVARPSVSLMSLEAES